MRSQKRASLNSHMELSNNAISQEPLILFSIWFMEQEMCLFYHIIDIRDESSRPDPIMTLIDGLFISKILRYKLDKSIEFVHRF